MYTVRLAFRKMDIERILISFTIMIMEGVGFVMLICGILGIKLF